MQSIFPRLASYLKSNSFGLNFINFLVVEIFVKRCHAIFKARVDTQRAFQNHSGISKRISLNQYFPMICICKTFANGKFSYWKRRNVKIQFAGCRGVRRSQSPQMQTGGGDGTLSHFFPEGRAPSTPRPYFMDRQKRGQKLLSMAVQEKLSKRGFYKGQGTYPRPKGHKFCWFSPAAGQLATNCASLLRTENWELRTQHK